MSAYTPGVSLHTKPIKGELESAALSYSHYYRIQSADIWDTVFHASYLEEQCAQSADRHATPALSPAVGDFL